MQKVKINEKEYSFKMTLGVFKRLGIKHKLTFGEIQNSLASEDINIELLVDFISECNKVAVSLNGGDILPDNFDDMIAFNELGNIVSAIAVPSEGDQQSGE